MLHVIALALGSGIGHAGLIPYDTRWEYPHYLTFRPGHGQVCRVNPPRMSWPYLPHVIPAERNVPVHSFTL